MVGNRPQENTRPKLAAYRRANMQGADEELRYLQEQVRQLRGINSEDHFNAIAAYQPSTRKNNHSGCESEELQRLRTAQRESQLQQHFQQSQNRMNCSEQDVFQLQKRMMNKIRRLQARLEGFMRIYANRNNRQ